MVSILLGVDDQSDVGTVSQKVLSKVDKLDKPNNVKASVGGANEDISNAIIQLSVAMLAAIIIVVITSAITTPIIVYGSENKIANGAKPPLNVNTRTKYTMIIAANIATESWIIAFEI